MNQKISRFYRKTKTQKKQKTQSKKSLTQSKRKESLKASLKSLNAVIEKLDKLIPEAYEILDVTRDIQKQKVPTESSVTPDFEFSMKFIPGSSQGGNYHNIIEQKDPFCFGMILAESTNYRTSAVFLSQIMQLGEALRSKDRSQPSYVGGVLTREIPPLLEPKDESHCFYAKVDRRSFEMSYINLGKVVALLQKEGKKSLISLSSTSGSIKKNLSNSSRKTRLPNLKEKKVFLDAKDRLIFCTQNLLKAKNERGESFGRKRLYKSILKAPKKNIHALRNQILFDSSQFSKNTPFSKDLTVLTCEIKERVIKLAKEE